jgi:hypothetical protein
MCAWRPTLKWRLGALAILIGDPLPNDPAHLGRYALERRRNGERRPKRNDTFSKAKAEPVDPTPPSSRFKKVDRR